MSEIKMKMSLDSSGVKKGLKKAKAGIKSFAKSAKDALGSIAGGGIAAVVAGFGVAANSAMGYGKELLNLSKLANTNFEDFQKQAAGAKTVGIEHEKLADIYKDTSDKVGDFLETGGGAMADYFENIAPLIGQTADEFRGLSGADALQKYYDGLQQANLDQETMTFYMEAIASDSAALIPLLQDGGAAFKKLGDEAESAGALMEKATAESLKRAEDAIDSFKKKAIIKAGDILTMFAGLGGGGVLTKSEGEKDRDKAFDADRAAGVDLLQEEGANFSDADAKALADTSTSVEALTRILGNYELKLLDLYQASASLRKEEKAGSREAAEAAEKETAAKVAKIELAKKELALVKPLKKAKEELAKAEEKARTSGMSDVDILSDLNSQKASLKKNITWLERWKDSSKETMLQLVEAKTKLLGLDEDIKKATESAAKNQKSQADAAMSLGESVAADALDRIEKAKEAQEKADEAHKKAAEEAEKQIDQGLQSKLLDAQISQRADVIHSVEKEIELRERIKQIAEDTGKTEAEARALANAAMRIEAGPDANQSGFVTPMEQRKWNREQKALAREQKKVNQAEKRAERDKGGNIKKAIGGKERAALRAADRQKRADDREFKRRKNRGEKAEDVLADIQKKKDAKEMKDAEKKGKGAELRDKRAKAKAAAAAAKKPKKPENAVVKELKPIMKDQLEELKKINKALHCNG